MRCVPASGRHDAPVHVEGTELSEAAAENDSGVLCNLILTLAIGSGRVCDLMGVIEKLKRNSVARPRTRGRGFSVFKLPPGAITKTGPPDDGEPV